jgi:acylphosphatase
VKANRISVSGKVQGVYFRVYAKQKVLNLGVRGFVQNESDGTVSVEVEGSDAAIAEMVSWCKKGPGLARVKAIELTELPARNFVSFDIKK